MSLGMQFLLQVVVFVFKNLLVCQWTLVANVLIFYLACWLTCNKGTALCPAWDELFQTACFLQGLCFTPCIRWLKWKIKDVYYIFHILLKTAATISLQIWLSAETAIELALSSSKKAYAYLLHSKQELKDLQEPAGDVVVAIPDHKQYIQSIYIKCISTISVQ